MQNRRRLRVRQRQHARPRSRLNLRLLLHLQILLCLSLRRRLQFLHRLLELHVLGAHEFFRVRMDWKGFWSQFFSQKMSQFETTRNPVVKMAPSLLYSVK
jgi:hypothetical protein